MNKPTLPLIRVHHFYVAIAKFLFHHPERGIVTVQDPIKINDAKRYGLSPLILYGLTVAGLPIRWMTFTPVDRPRAFRDVLLEAWHHGEALRGLPDVLQINRHLALASPDLTKHMEKLKVQVEVADANEKSLPASLRSAQDSTKCFLGNFLEKQDKKDLSLSESIQTLCRDAQNDHDIRIKIGHGCGNRREIEERIQHWMNLPIRKPVPTLIDGLDWEPGPWLSSWESSLPPNPPRHFNSDNSWLLTGENVPEETDDDEDIWGDGCYDNVAEIAKSLIACWPNPPVEISKCLGITLRDIQWFTSGKAPLDRSVRFDLEALLGIEYDERRCSYIAAGPCVLIARTPKALEESYEHLSHGGDANPFEIIPSQGTADPSWRYIIINTYGEQPSILMAPRGVKITERVPDLLMNYDGIKPVDPEFYRDVASTCARACREPAANIREMNDFAKRYDERWVDCAWEPEF
ncbi:MAG TPA: hypothetical protein PKW95_16055 [bacterium]|nr:hypothetical protein [bacterium]